MNRWLLAIGSMAVGAGLVLGFQQGAARWRQSHPSEAGGVVLASVDGQVITVDAFKREMLRRGGSYVGIFAKPERRRALLDEMIRFQVLLANARHAGYERDPEVRAGIERMLAGKFRAEQIDPRLISVTVTQDEIEAYFRQHIAEFAVPELAHAAVLHFAWTPTTTEEGKQTIRQRAETARAEALTQSGRTFGAVAIKSDDQATRYLGGDIGWIERGEKDSGWEPAVLDTIFGLTRPGELAPTLTTEHGIYLIKLIEEKKPATTRPLDEVRVGIQERLTSERRQRVAEQVYADAQHGLRVEVDEARLAAIEVPSEAIAQEEDKKPPALPPA